MSRITLLFIFSLTILSASTLECSYPLKHSPENGACIKPCPDYQFYHPDQNVCKEHCPPHIENQLTVQGVRLCGLPCPSDLILHVVGKHIECVWECPSGLKLNVINTIQQCVRICPEDEFYTEVGSSKCLKDCPLLEENFKAAKICKFPCQKSEFWHPGSNECSSECLAPLVIETVADVKVCKYPCQKGEIWDQEAKSCKKTCSSPYWVRTGHLGLQSCEKPCKSEDEFWIKESNQCVNECPDFWVASTVSTVKICKFPCSRDYYYNPRTKGCQDSCLWPFSKYQNPETMATICYPRCPKDQVLLNNECQKECPFPWKTESFSDAAFCLKPCPDFQLWDNTTLSCRNLCPGFMKEQIINEIPSCVPRCNKTEEYFSFIDKTCYSSCPEPLVPDSSDGFNACHKPCQAADAYDPRTKTCVHNCPALTRRVDDSNGVAICTPYCKKGLIFSPYGCVETCEEPSVLVEEGGLEFCQLDCPEGSFVLLPFKECVSSCPRTHERAVDKKMNKYLQEEFVDVCQPRCSPLNPFKLDNRGCFSSLGDIQRRGSTKIEKCPEGYILELHSGFPTCREPCKPLEYWNEVTLTCEKSCPEPWKSRKINNGLTCFKPCQGSEFYLVEMQMCLPACPNSWIPETVDGVNLCRQPCGVSDYFYPANKTCSSTCPRSWMINTYEDNYEAPKIKFQNFLRVCKQPCAPGEFRLEDETCSSSCPEFWPRPVKEEVVYCSRCQGSWWLWFEREKRCVMECPEDHKMDVENEIWRCVARCNEGEIWSKDQLKCLKEN